MKSNSGGKAVRYNKWGYIFLIPFIVVFVIFQLVPLVNTIYNSFFENYMSGLTQVGPRFVGLDNYKALFSSGDIWTYFKNTMVLWIMCFIPQIFLSLLLGAWFSDVRLKLKGSRFFKTVIYLPNLIMASAFSMLFFTLFSDGGPINSLLMQIGFISEPYKFLSHAGSARGLIAMMNCLMWFGNTTILLMAGMMEARRKAESLLLEATKEAERIKEQASKEGYTEGWERGCQEGKARAVEEGKQQDLLRRQEFHDSMARALEAIEKEKDACLRRYLEELKDLAVAVGEKVIRISLKSNGDVIRCMIEAETEKMKKKAWVRIYMEREDYETMIQADKDAVSHLARLSDNVKFIVMEQASGGSCIIEMPDEIIDMSVDTQIENIRRLVGELRF